MAAMALVQEEGYAAIHPEAEARPELCLLMDVEPGLSRDEVLARARRVGADLVAFLWIQRIEVGTGLAKIVEQESRLLAEGNTVATEVEDRQVVLVHADAPSPVAGGCLDVREGCRRQVDGIDVGRPGRLEGDSLRF